MTRLEDIGPKLNRLSLEIEKIANSISFLSANFAKEVIDGRIWGPGGAKAKNGSLLPQYSAEYLKQLRNRKKNKVGIPTTSTWDLQREGDLMGSLVLSSNISTKKTKLVIVGDKQVAKADSLEKRAGKVIFELSDAEQEEVLRKTIASIRKQFDAAFKKIF